MKKCTTHSTIKSPESVFSFHMKTISPKRSLSFSRLQQAQKLLIRRQRQWLTTVGVGDEILELQQFNGVNMAFSDKRKAEIEVLVKRLFTGLIVVILLFIQSLSIFAQDQFNSKLDSANSLYQQQLYAQANSMYLDVVNAGFESAGLYYNIGNTYYKIGNYPKAILFYERALLLDPKNDDILFNLEKARLYTIDKVDEIPEFFIHRVVRTWTTMLSSNTWSLISIGFIISFLVFAIIFITSRNIGLRKTGFYVGFLSLIFSAVFYYLAARSKSFITDSTAAIVMTPTVTIKASPSSNSGDLFIIHEGTKVQVTDSIDTWKEIRLSDGKQGWILSTDIEPI